MNKKLILGIVLIVLCLLLVGCSKANNPKYEEEPANFGDGIWHGLTQGFILLWDTVAKVEDPTIYAENNVGYWYNCGFSVVGPMIGLLLAIPGWSLLLAMIKEA